MDFPIQCIIKPNKTNIRYLKGGKNMNRFNDISSIVENVENTPSKSKNYDFRYNAVS